MVLSLAQIKLFSFLLTVVDWLFSSTTPLISKDLCFCQGMSGTPKEKCRSFLTGGREIRTGHDLAGRWMLGGQKWIAFRCAELNTGNWMSCVGRGHGEDMTPADQWAWGGLERSAGNMGVPVAEACGSLPLLQAGLGSSEHGHSHWKGCFQFPSRWWQFRRMDLVVDLSEAVECRSADEDVIRTTKALLQMPSLLFPSVLSSCSEHPKAPRTERGGRDGECWGRNWAISRDSLGSEAAACAVSFPWDGGEGPPSPSFTHRTVFLRF